MLSAQYLVNCLEEDHVCHGITTQEPRPRPMKETLHSRHNSTVLPRLGASSKESLRNLHTHALDSDTKLLGNNKVLKERPTPISDEEQRLNRRQRCTLCCCSPSETYGRKWGDSNFQILAELPVPPQAAGVVGTFECDLYIYIILSTTVSHFFWTSFFVYISIFASTLCMCVMHLTSI